MGIAPQIFNSIKFAFFGFKYVHNNVKIIQNYPVGSILSFFSPWGLRTGETIKLGGLEPPTMKKLKGARFGWPSGLRVLRKAIGRGCTALTSSEYLAAGGRSDIVRETKSCGTPEYGLSLQPFWWRYNR